MINGGTASGNSFLHFINVGGPGAQTTGNGILVVQTINNGTTATNAFTLAGETRAGVYDYDLFRGSPANINDPTVANDWFLRSTFLGNGGNGDGGPVTPPGVLPPVPPPDNGVPPPPGIWPIIGPEIATYGVVQPIARQMGSPRSAPCTSASAMRRRTPRA
ncbi:autotransporter outer membrane beta-barrel domain-containing protein [Bradyrhizobium sp. NAS80.1]|uniref:autotransporter outer membrane beta-barrel domain-containing protein n=1 Tax=Bradyrhizobium sp. NAS80.1 TaxID=1680159 RepID=UPI001FD89CD9|nr:autotransporter outer membrane beta-barrel domain-containing protein [Bradyrhizobium sp. NAS80.1]